MKAVAVSVPALSFEQPRTILSLPLAEGEPEAISSMATLYAELQEPAPATVAVRLVAELMGTRQAVATAGIPPGFSGIAALATGIVADAWHVEAWGRLHRGKLDVKLAVRECCSGHNVMVPAALQVDVPWLHALTPEAILPLNRHEGAYQLRAGVDGVEPIAATERILRVVATAGVAVGGLSGFSRQIWHWPSGATVSAYPRGNLEGPRSLSFSNTVYYQVEVVS